MAKSPAYSGPVTKHQQLAQTGHAEGYAHGGHTSMHEHHPKSHHGGHTSMKHGGNVGHGTHGHKGPHEHHTKPGHGHSGHHGHSVHSLVSDGKSGGPAESIMDTYTDTVETDGGGGKHHNGGHTGGTGHTRNPI